MQREVAQLAGCGRRVVGVPVSSRSHCHGAAAVRANSGYAGVVFFLVALIIAGLFLLHRLVRGYPQPRERYVVIGVWDAAFLDAAASTFFPAGGSVPLSGLEADLPGYADRYLASLPSRQRLLIRALFMLFEQSTIVLPARGLGAFRRFSSMTPEQRKVVLRGWAESRFYLRRFAFTALKAVLIMGYFGRPECLQFLEVESFEIETPIARADLLYPPIGQALESIQYAEADLTPPSDGTPVNMAEGIR